MTEEQIITAQFLYDLRAMTGFISGQDLHRLFNKFVGEPSPKGRTPIPALAMIEVYEPLLTRILDSPNWADSVTEYFTDVTSLIKSEKLVGKTLREISPEVLRDMCRAGEDQWGAE